MNPDLERLQPYPFERLHRLMNGATPPRRLASISLSIGEPQHKAPEFITGVLVKQLSGLNRYPLTKGTAELRSSIADWLGRRFSLPQGSIDPERHILPVNGTREALFAFAQSVVDRSAKPLVLMPNPFYQIYEGATLLAGAEPRYLNTTAESAFLPDFDAIPDHVWRRCQLVYICTPGNPTGTILDIRALQGLIEQADKHDFVIASDECYSEIYPDEEVPPCGLLEAAAGMGRNDYNRCMVFHSLSKRSNLPGMRSGFVAGNAALIRDFLRYRTYHGCAMSPPVQSASIAAWQDEAHVEANRHLYRDKFNAVLDILSPYLDIEMPDAGFYLWPATPASDEDFTRGLYEQQHVSVLPGSYLAREAHGLNPGRNHVRIALVAPLPECIEAAKRIRNYIRTL